MCRPLNTPIPLGGDLATTRRGVGEELGALGRRRFSLFRRRPERQALATPPQRFRAVLATRMASPRRSWRPRGDAATPARGALATSLATLLRFRCARGDPAAPSRRPWRGRDVVATLLVTSLRFRGAEGQVGYKTRRALTIFIISKMNLLEEVTALHIAVVENQLIREAEERQQREEAVRRGRRRMPKRFCQKILGPKLAFS